MANEKHITVKENNAAYIGDTRVGFLSDSGEVFLQRCPQCGSENYAPSVALGICAWCGYDVSELMIRNSKKKEV